MELFCSKIAARALAPSSLIWALAKFRYVMYLFCFNAGASNTAL